MKTTRPILALAFGASLVVAVVTGAIYILAFRAPVAAVDSAADSVLNKSERVLKMARKVVDYVSEKLQFAPKVVIGEKTVIESKQSVAELAVATKSYSHTYRWEHSFTGSKKRIEIKGDFIAKAGYKLRSPMELRFTEDGGSMTMLLPEATVLSNEMTHFTIVRDDDGWWNKVSTDDREKALNELKRSADKFTVQSGLLREADESMIQHLQKALNEASETRVLIKREAPPLPRS